MSTSCFITPFDPIIYHDNPPATSPSDMAIDVDDFVKHLKEQWPDVEFPQVAHLLTWDIEQGLTSLWDGKEYPFRAYLHEDRQTISFKWANAFTLWYRLYIPETQPLYFFCESSWESLQLIPATTMKDIDTFLQDL